MSRKKIPCHRSPSAAVPGCPIWPPWRPLLWPSTVAPRPSPRSRPRNGLELRASSTCIRHVNDTHAECIYISYIYMYNLYNIYTTLLYNYTIIYIYICSYVYTIVCVCILYIIYVHMITHVNMIYHRFLRTAKMQRGCIIPRWKLVGSPQISPILLGWV